MFLNFPIVLDYRKRKQVEMKRYRIFRSQMDYIKKESSTECGV